MKTMAVAWNGTTLNDKVKLLSVTELDVYYASETSTIIEGNYYQIFRRSKNEGYWLRTRHTSAGTQVWDIMNTVNGNYHTYSTTLFSLAPCIRLG